MIVSHNEILVTCQKALEAAGFSQGVREDAADSIAWLEQIGVSVLSNLCAGMAQLQPVKAGWALQADRPNRFALATNGGSCLQFGSLAADYALTKAQAFDYSIGSIDGSEPGLWIGYMRHAARAGIHSYVAWQHGTNLHQYRFAAHESFPDYVCVQVETQDDGHVRLSMSQTPLTLAGEHPWTFSRDEPHPPHIVARVSSAEFATKRQYHLLNGITVDDTCWQQLKEIAKGILVEDTEESRARGAGGA